MSFLNQVQRAALQQMGISVWLSAERVAQENASSQKQPQTGKNEPSAGFATQRPVNKSASVARVAQLRESLNSTASAEKDEAPMRLTDAQRADGADAIADLNVAWAVCHPEQPMPEIFVGNLVSVTLTSIVIPAAPAALNARQKAKLWTLLCQ